MARVPDEPCARPAARPRRTATRPAGSRRGAPGARSRAGAGPGSPPPRSRATSGSTRNSARPCSAAPCAPASRSRRSARPLLVHACGDRRAERRRQWRTEAAPPISVQSVSQSGRRRLPGSAPRPSQLGRLPSRGERRVVLVVADARCRTRTSPAASPRPRARGGDDAITPPHEWPARHRAARSPSASPRAATTGRRAHRSRSARAAARQTPRSQARRVPTSRARCLLERGLELPVQRRGHHRPERLPEQDRPARGIAPLAHGEAGAVDLKLSRRAAHGHRAGDAPTSRARPGPPSTGTSCAPPRRGAVSAATRAA